MVLDTMKVVQVTDSRLVVRALRPPTIDAPTTFEAIVS